MYRAPAAENRVIQFITNVVMLVLLAGCAGGTTVQGAGGDRTSQGHVGWRLPL